MGPARFRFTAEVWLYPGEAGWHFATLPAELADEIRARFEGGHRAFGSLAVRATIGSTTWSTSLFRDTRRESYLLPVKAQVRRAEGIADGDVVDVALELEG